MRIGCRSVAFATALAAVLAFGATAHAVVPPPNKCAAGKVGIAAKNIAGLLKCDSKGVATGTLPVAACLTKVGNAFLKFPKIDSGQSVLKLPSVCPAGKGDAALIQGQNQTEVDAIEAALGAPTFPTTISKCTAGKMGCAAKRAAGLLKCHSKAIGKGLPMSDPAIAPCVTKVSAGMPACYTKIDSGLSDCLAPEGDEAAIAALIDPYVDHIANYFSGYVNQSPGCASQIVFAGTTTKGVLDTGWTGQGHNATVVSEGTVTVAVDTCTGDGSAPSCGVCSYHGPVPNLPLGSPSTPNLWPQRCSNNTSTKCVNDSACGVGNTCKFYFGSYLPLVAGGVSTCVENTFTGALTGTTDYATGDSTGTAHVVSRVFSGLALTHPCPRCIGDPVANDGVKGGTCDNGPNVTKTCDASGASPNASLGVTSLDCPPIDPGGVIANLPIDLSNTTGNKTKTLSAATSPPCTDGTFVGGLCQCDTCNNTAATPCGSNADCVAVGATVCGGLRCTGGTNNGVACANNSECPGGGAACSVPGAATAGNQCDGGIGDCGDNPQVGDPNKRTCLSGPSETFCGPVETFKGCAINADCTFPGDLCNVTRFRDCFDNGSDGDVVTASGVADPPSGHDADPTLAALFCIGPTTAGAVNSAAGLPGLGRLELGGHAHDNGTP
jgi:hypothetical protein